MSEGILARLLAAYAEEGFSISIGLNLCRESPNGCFAYLIPLKQQTSLDLEELPTNYHCYLPSQYKLTQHHQEMSWAERGKKFFRRFVLVRKVHGVLNRKKKAVTSSLSTSATTTNLYLSAGGWWWWHLMRFIFLKRC